MIDWRDAPPFGRRVSLQHTLELLHARCGPSPLILEIGTSESYNPDGLGNALLAFAWYAGKYGARVKSVDTFPGTVKNSREILRRFIPQYAEVPEIVCADAYDWATTIYEPIALAYMDAGCELITDANYAAYAKRNAATIPPFYPQLFERFEPICFQPGAFMLIDDTDPVTYWGKGIFLIPKLLAGGWRLIELRGVPVFPMVLLEKL